METIAIHQQQQKKVAAIELGVMVELMEGDNRNSEGAIGKVISIANGRGFAEVKFDNGVQRFVRMEQLAICTPMRLRDIGVNHVSFTYSEPTGEQKEQCIEARIMISVCDNSAIEARRTDLATEVEALRSELAAMEGQLKAIDKLINRDIPGEIRKWFKKGLEERAIITQVQEKFAALLKG